SPLPGGRRARQRMSAQWSGLLVVSQQPRPRGASYKGREMNKQIVKQTMLSLEARDLESAREKYLEYVGSARLDRGEPIEDDEQAQAEFASDLSEAFDDTVSLALRQDREALGDGLRAEEQGGRRRSGEVRWTVFRYCRVDRWVCVRRQRDHGHLDPGTDLC